MSAPDAPRPDRGPLALPLLLVSLIGLVASGYLFVVHELGGTPVCGPIGGCETVAASEYSAVLGIPVAAFGFALSLVLAACAALWWRRADRRPLLLAYGLLLPATLVVAYLTYLELFVIHAVCVWCATYALTILGSLGISALALRRG